MRYLYECPNCGGKSKRDVPAQDRDRQRCNAPYRMGDRGGVVWSNYVRYGDTIVCGGELHCIQTEERRG